MKKFHFAFLLFFFIFFAGCKKDLSQSEGLTGTSSNEAADKKIVVHQASSLDYSSFEALTATDVQNLTEAQAITLLQPSVTAGTTIYNDLISQVVGTPEWNNLTSQEQSYILNFTDQQKSILAILLDSGNNISSSGGDTRWLHCALSALGFNQAYTLFAKAFSVGMSAETAVAALRFVGLKYLGYIALAVAIYEFVECIIQPTCTSCGIIVNSTLLGLLNIDDNSSQTEINVAKAKLQNYHSIIDPALVNLSWFMFTTDQKVQAVLTYIVTNNIPISESDKTDLTFYMRTVYSSGFKLSLNWADILYNYVEVPNSETAESIYCGIQLYR